MTFQNKATQAVAQAELCQKERHLLALQCTWDIAAIADAIGVMADEAGDKGDMANEALLRCYGLRIADLNATVMFYIDGDQGMTAKDMHKAIFGRMKQSEEVHA